MCGIVNDTHQSISITRCTENHGQLVSGVASIHLVQRKYLAAKAVVQYDIRPMPIRPTTDIRLSY